MERYSLHALSHRSFSLQKEVYMIAAGVIGGVFVVCTLVMFLGVKEKDGESKKKELSTITTN